jgi:hypothetical protein
LQQVSSDPIVRAPVELFDDPFVLIRARLALDKNGAQFFGLGKRLDSGLVQRLFVYLQELAKRLAGFHWHSAENLVGF